MPLKHHSNGAVDTCFLTTYFQLPQGLPNFTAENLFIKSISLPSYHGDKKKKFQIAFYNVENLFDTINAPGKNDGEYTPESKKNWNTDKYQTK